MEVPTLNVNSSHIPLLIAAGKCVCCELVYVVFLAFPGQYPSSATTLVGLNELHVLIVTVNISSIISLLYLHRMHGSYHILHAASHQLGTQTTGCVWAMHVVV